jgi:PHD/YefM family antitoxin component YafN of YafNO toxin-antitoxin module
MMGRREDRQRRFFYEFNLDEVVPPDHHRIDGIALHIICISGIIAIILIVCKGLPMSDMIRVSSAEFQKTFGLLADKAITAPIAITKHGRDHLVVLSAVEYARLKRRDRRVGLAAELPDDLLAEVEQARM